VHGARYEATVAGRRTVRGIAVHQLEPGNRAEPVEATCQQVAVLDLHLGQPQARQRA